MQALLPGARRAHVSPAPARALRASGSWAGCPQTFCTSESHHSHCTPHAAAPRSPFPTLQGQGEHGQPGGGQGVGQLPPSPLVPRHYRQQPCLQPTTAAFSAGSQCSPVLLVTPPWAQARSAVGLTVWHTSGDAGEPELLHEASPWCEAQRAHPRALHCMQSVQWVAPPCAAGAPQSITHSSGAAG